jgi:hypothetical protein
LAEYYTNHNYGGFKKRAFLNVYNYGRNRRLRQNDRDFAAQVSLEGTPETSGNPAVAWCRARRGEAVQFSAAGSGVFLRGSHSNTAVTVLFSATFYMDEPNPAASWMPVFCGQGGPACRA